MWSVKCWPKPGLANTSASRSGVAGCGCGVWVNGSVVMHLTVSLPSAPENRDLEDRTSDLFAALRADAITPAGVRALVGLAAVREGGPWGVFRSGGWAGFFGGWVRRARRGGSVALAGGGLGCG